MPDTEADRLAHGVFVLTLLGKGVLGVLQLVTAAALLLGVAERMPALARALVRQELAEDPTDFLAARIVALSDRLPGSGTTFYAIYFGGHGLLHIGVVAALLSGRMWAYPAGIVMLAGFVVYQMAEWSMSGGPVLLALSAIDLLVIALTVHEWRHRAGRA